jgi:superfamily I DNA/RNA helicase
VEGERISRSVAIRLVRGFSGSGKTLVLMQRARFLAAQYPEWKIAVLTFNKPLQELLEGAFAGTSVQVRTFDSLCQSFMRKQGEAFRLSEWLEWNKFDYSIIRALGNENAGREINWLREMGITDQEAYLSTPRHGIGKEVRLSMEQRGAVFEACQAYRDYLREKGFWDWEELRLNVLEELRAGRLSHQSYDAILIDEAQDWAPGWLQVIRQFLKPGHGLLFLADDPSQSIYRYFSWKEKGIDVVGRTRWLRVPYRNTYEIYQAAYNLIAAHQEIQASLSESGELVKPDLNSAEMRHGEKPLVRRCQNAVDELAYIKNKIDTLRREGYRDEQIAILARHRNDLDPIKNAMRGYGVKVNPIHSFNGLEMEAVFIPYLHKTFTKEDEDAEATERRLHYMAMTRARSQLVLTYSGKLPKAYEGLRQAGLADFLG